jgi:hypothetical protein
MTDTIDDVAAAQEEPAVPALDEQGIVEQLVAQAREKGIELVGPNIQADRAGQRDSEGVELALHARRDLGRVSVPAGHRSNVGEGVREFGRSSEDTPHDRPSVEPRR